MKIGGLRYVLRGNFQLWKLHTAADYLSFFLFLLAGIAVFVVAAKCMNRRRNHETAVNKVMKRLGKLGKEALQGL